jgi:hypothetical protein
MNIIKDELIKRMDATPRSSIEEKCSNHDAPSNVWRRLRHVW